MTEDYGCPVCGKHFSEEEDLKGHGKDDHPEVQENYPETFDKDVKVEEPKEAEEIDWENVPEEEWDDVVLRKVNGDTEEPAQELDVNEEPLESHDDWQKQLQGLKDEFAGEEEKCAICNGDHQTIEHPVFAPEEDEELIDLSSPEGIKVTNDLNRPFDLVPELPAKEDSLLKVDEEPEGVQVDVLDQWDNANEEGADDPLKKVADLAESYRYLSRDKRSQIFESLGFTQGDSAILSGLEWNELTRPIRVEASEAYAKEEDHPTEEETGEDEEDKVYENIYDLESNHDSPDYKKKAIECPNCNEKFYNDNDKNIHFNELHANEEEYELPEQCPLCNEIIQEPENLDWHMQQQHGASVPSAFTQAGIQGAMADTDFDALETIATESKWECLDCDSNFDDAGKHQEETGHHNIIKKTEEVSPHIDLDDTTQYVDDPKEDDKDDGQ
jgi:uncharacterized C2H2 Zn-finger protein